MALEGARGVKGDFTQLPGLVRKGAQVKTFQKHWLHLWLLVLPVAGCREGVMGQSTGWHGAGVDVLGKSFDC